MPFVGQYIESTEIGIANRVQDGSPGHSEEHEGVLHMRYHGIRNNCLLMVVGRGEVHSLRNTGQGAEHLEVGNRCIHPRVPAEEGRRSHHHPGLDDGDDGDDDGGVPFLLKVC